VTKQEVLDRLNEIAWRFVRVEDPDPQHYKELGLAFGLAWVLVSQLSEEDIRVRVEVIERLGLAGGSKH